MLIEDNSLVHMIPDPLSEGGTLAIPTEPYEVID